jgi:hypothetical protein
MPGPVNIWERRKPPSKSSAGATCEGRNGDGRHDAKDGFPERLTDARPSPPWSAGRVFLF